MFKCKAETCIPKISIFGHLEMSGETYEASTII